MLRAKLFWESYRIHENGSEVEKETVIYEKIVELQYRGGRAVL
jgi:hypothetical protein